MKHIVEPLFVSHCILVQYCFLMFFVSIILRHLCPVHQIRGGLSVGCQQILIVEGLSKKI